MFGFSQNIHDITLLKLCLCNYIWCHCIITCIKLILSNAPIIHIHAFGRSQNQWALGIRVHQRVRVHIMLVPMIPSCKRSRNQKSTWILQWHQCCCFNNDDAIVMSNHSTMILLFPWCLLVGHLHFIHTKTWECLSVSRQSWLSSSNSFSFQGNDNKHLLARSLTWHQLVRHGWYFNMFNMVWWLRKRGRMEWWINTELVAYFDFDDVCLEAICSTTWKISRVETPGASSITAFTRQHTIGSNSHFKHGGIEQKYLHLAYEHAITHLFNAQSFSMHKQHTSQWQRQTDWLYCLDLLTMCVFLTSDCTPYLFETSLWSQVLVAKT